MQMVSAGAPVSLSYETWPTANRIFYYPLLIPEACMVVKVGIVNGSAVSGDSDVGIYDAAGNRLINSGATAQSGTNGYQVYDIGNTPLERGMYYLALTYDNTTSRVRGIPFSGIIGGRMMGVWTELPGSFGLPAAAAFSAPSSGVVALASLMLEGF